MAFGDPPRNGNGMFPYAFGVINQNHPLYPNLVFLGVAYAGGYMDLVTRAHSRWQGPNSGIASFMGPVAPFQTGTSAGCAWQFGTQTVNTNSRAQFNNLNLSPLTSSNGAIACGFVNMVPAIVGGRIFQTLNPSNQNTGCFEFTQFGSAGQGFIYGNGGSNNLVFGNISGNGIAENLVMSNTVPTATIYWRSGIGTTSGTFSTTSRTSCTGVTQASFSALSGDANRTPIWAAVWNAPLTAFQAGLIAPLRGIIPPGLIISRQVRAGQL